MQAVNLLQRARNLGIDPNTIMYNTAISALGKSFRWEAAEELFRMIPCPASLLLSSQTLPQNTYFVYPKKASVPGSICYADCNRYSAKNTLCRFGDVGAHDSFHFETDYESDFNPK